MTARTPLLAALAGAAASLAAPAGALAVTGHANKACYSHVPTKGSEPIVVSLAGGTPGQDFQLLASDPGAGEGSAGSVLGTYDAAGNATATITSVFPPSGSIDPLKGQKVLLSVKDFTPAGQVTTPLGSVLITNLAVDVSNKPTNPRKRRRVKVSGTPFAGKRVYGFITTHKGHHVLKRIRLGKGNVCGYVSKRAVVAPPHYQYRTYRLWVNAGKHLHRSRAIWYEFRIFRF